MKVPNYTNSILLFSFIFICCNDRINLSEDENSVDQSINTCADVINNCRIVEDSITLDIHWNDGFFLNRSIGYFSGNYGDLFKTSDGTDSWEKLVTGTDYHIRSIFFLNEEVGFLGGLKQWDNYGGIFLSTVNGGETWDTRTFNDTLGVDKLYFYDENNGIARLRYSDSYVRYALSRTEDGGITWKKLDIPYLRALIPIVHTKNRIYVACSDDNLYVSKNKGVDWERVVLPSELSKGISEIYFANDLLGFVSRNDFVFRTEDGGVTWDEITISTPELDGMHFFDEKNGFMIHHIYEYEYIDGVIIEFPTYQGMKILETTNGGQSWSESDLIEDCRLGQKLHFYHSDMGYSMMYNVLYHIEKM